VAVIGSRTLVLASASPRRLSLLRQAGFEVTVAPANADESWPEACDAAEAVVQLALRKVRTIGDRYRETPVLGADTEVVQDGVPLGKPESRQAAADMISQLAGRDHTVFTGVALTCKGREWSGVAASQVHFRPLARTAIEEYLDRGTYADKAGAYGIQDDGRDLVESYTGRMDTIVGLPLDVVESLWQKMVREEK
jgi:septum formation protein